jgi:probable phosphoglycerate mutase
MSLKTLYLLRHGQTEFNVAGRLQGRLDSPLTMQGIAQAQAMGRLLASRIRRPRDWLVLSSPLGRARKTADLVASALGILRVVEDTRLREVSFGDWEGLNDAEIKAEWPDRFGRGSRGDWLFAAPNGESMLNAFARAQTWLADPALPENLVVVSHGLFGQLLRGDYLGLDEQVTLALDRPHGTVFQLSEGAVERFDCTPVPA